MSGIVQVGSATSSTQLGVTTITLTRSGVHPSSFLSLVVISSKVPSAITSGWSLDKSQPCLDSPSNVTNIYHLSNAVAGSNSVTVDFATAANVTVVMTEWSGMFNATVDKTSGMGYYTSTNDTGSTGTLSYSDELAIAALQFVGSSGDTITSPSGWVTQLAATGSLERSVVSQVTTVTTALNPAWGTTFGNRENANAIVTYIPGTAPASATLSSPGRNTILSTSVTGTVTSDSAGGTLYAVASTSSSTPTEAQIVAGTGGGIVSQATQTALSGANSIVVSGLSTTTTYYLYFYQDNGSPSNIVGSSSFTTLAPAPNITSVSSDNPREGALFTITGDHFEATQGTGYVSIGGITQPIVSWSDTSIVVTLDLGTNKCGVAANVVVHGLTVGAGNNYALTTLQPPVGWAFINLATPNATASHRVTSIADLSSGDQIKYDTVGGLVEMFDDATYSADSTVSAFSLKAWTPNVWGALGTETLISDIVINANVGSSTIQGLTATITFGEQLALAESTTVSESLEIEVLHNCRAVISDIIIQSKELTLTSFQELVDVGHAAGFETFKDFIPGDYEYQHSLFRAKLNSISSDRARLTTTIVQVDVPDVFESGSATIDSTHVSAGVRVDFNRHFHVPPEVTMNVKGGTSVSFPRLVGSVDTTGFTAIMTDASNNHVTGTFTWAAHGY